MGAIFSEKLYISMMLAIKNFEQKDFNNELKVACKYGNVPLVKLMTRREREPTIGIGH